MEIYSEYEQEKLKILRDKANQEFEAKRKRQEDIKVRKKDFNSLKVGDAIFYRSGFKSALKGEVIDRVEKRGVVSFDIRCGKEVYLGIEFNENVNALTRRVTSKERYKDVKVRKEIQDLPTNELLAKLREEDPYHDEYYWDYYSDSNPEERNHQMIKELRAELSRRPNIKSKKQKKESR